MTGGIASGKSEVSQMFADLGAVIIDSDVLAREVVEPGTPALRRIVARFGKGVLNEDGSLNRAALGEIVFNDEVARADLNAIVHPAIRARSAELTLQGPPLAQIIHVIPLLVETEQVDDYDIVIVVDCPEELQIKRLMERNGYTLAQARARVDAQASRVMRIEYADVIIDNSGDRESLRAQVEEVWRKLLAGEIRGLQR